MVKISIKDWFKMPESEAIQHLKVNKFTQKDWQLYEERKNNFDIFKVKTTFNTTEVVDENNVVISRVKSPYSARTRHDKRGKEKRYCKECLKVFYVKTNSHMLYCSIDCLTESVLRREFKKRKKAKRLLKIKKKQKEENKNIDIKERKKVSLLLSKSLKRAATVKEITDYIQQNPN